MYYYIYTTIEKMSNLSRPMLWKKLKDLNSSLNLSSKGLYKNKIFILNRILELHRIKNIPLPGYLNLAEEKGEYKENSLLRITKEAIILKQEVKMREVEREIKKAIMSDKIYIFKFTFTDGENQELPLTPRFIEFFINLIINKGVKLEEEETDGSDALEKILIKNVSNIDLRLFNKKEGHREKSGGFFPLMNCSPIDLKKYQIYNKEQLKSIKKYDTTDQETKKQNSNHREQCLLHTLRQAGIEENLISAIKFTFAEKKNYSHIKKTNLKQICKILKRKITLFEVMRANGVKKGFRIKKSTIKEKNTENKEEALKIGLFMGHYFLNEKTKYSRAQITNLEKYIEKYGKNWSKYSSINYKKTKVEKIDVINVLLNLYLKDYFKKTDMSFMFQSFRKTEIKDDIYLNLIDKEQECKGRVKKQEIKEEVKKMREKQDEEICILNKMKEEKVDEKMIKEQYEIVLNNYKRHIGPENTIKRKEFDLNIFYGDCETFVHDKEHKLYLIGVAGEENDEVDIINVCDFKASSTKKISKEQLAVNKLLDIITKEGTADAIIFFHNLKYDKTILQKYLDIVSMCEQKNAIYSMDVKYKKAKISFRDSYKILNFALSEFQSNFNLPKDLNKKECIAYSFYTEGRNDKWCKLTNYSSLLKNSSEIKEFNQIIENGEFETKTVAGIKYFKPTDYYKYYLKYDCLVLKHGLRKFEAVIDFITERKVQLISKKLSISSFTANYFEKNNVFKNIYGVKFNLRKYISKAITGGRVDYNKKYVRKVLNGNFQSIDAKSLYPSAIMRLNELIGGIPKGKAMRYKKSELKNWEEKTYSIMTVKILKVNKKQQMPFISFKDKDGILTYSNEVPEENMVIDSITLKAFIKFHEIEYEICEGVYWNSGGSKKMSKMINHLYNERIFNKKLENKALQQTIKLMLNSSYGKTIMNLNNTDLLIIKDTITAEDKKGKTYIKSKNNYEKFIKNNFNNLSNKPIEKISENIYKAHIDKIDETSNYSQVGCAILSASKYIMYEVFDILNDMNNEDDKIGRVYYTDTDSIHMNNDDVKELSSRYFNKYGKVLIGGQMGQFDCDFEIDDFKGKVVSKKLIVLGKKVYMDYLEGKDKDGNIINEVHFRMKGCTKKGVISKGIEYFDKKYNKDAKKDFSLYEDHEINEGIILLYEDLAEGKTVPILLNPKGSVLFEFDKGTVRTKTDFIRNVHFGNKKQKVKTKSKKQKTVKINKCECGCVIKFNNLKAHRDTKKHRTNMLNLNI